MMTETVHLALSTGNSNGYNTDKGNPSRTEVKEAELYTVDDLLVNRAVTFPTQIVLGYPSSPKGRADYVYYSNSDLDRFADEAARYLLSVGLPANVRVEDHRPGRLDI
jgi:hypothetical protein